MSCLRIFNFSVCILAFLALTPDFSSAVPTGVFIPVKGNFYTDNGMTEDQAKEAVKEANELLKQANIRLVYMKSNTIAENSGKDLKPPMTWGGDDSSGGGTAGDGVFTGDERDKGRTFGGTELIREFPRNKKGVKVSFVKGFAGTNPLGLSKHNNPTMFIRKSPEAAGGIKDTGKSIAHELGHILSINGHSAGADDLMNTTGSGTKFTAEQIREMNRFESKYARGKCVTQWGRAFGSTRDLQQFGTSVDGRGETARIADIDQVLLTGLHESDLTGQDNQNIHVQFTVGGPLPSQGDIFANYSLGFDTDNSAGTGNLFAGVAGIDRIVTLVASGNQELGTFSLMAELRDNPLGNATIFDAKPFFEVDNEFYDFGLGSEPAATSFFFEIPKNLLSLAEGDIPVVAATGPSISVSDDVTDPFVFDTQAWELFPELATYGNGTPQPNVDYFFDISGLTPYDPFTLYLDESEVFTGLLDENGNCLGCSFLFPEDVDPYQFHFLTAQDSTGEFAFNITCPVPEPSTWVLLVFGMAIVITRQRFFPTRRGCKKFV